MSFLTQCFFAIGSIDGSWCESEWCSEMYPATCIEGDAIGAQSNLFIENRYIGYCDEPWCVGSWCCVETQKYFNSQCDSFNVPSHEIINQYGLNYSDVVANQLIVEITSQVPVDCQMNSNKLSSFLQQGLVSIQDSLILSNQALIERLGIDSTGTQVNAAISGLTECYNQSDCSIADYSVVNSQNNSTCVSNCRSQSVIAIADEVYRHSQYSSYAVPTNGAQALFAIGSFHFIDEEATISVADTSPLHAQAVLSINSVPVYEYCTTGYCDTAYCYSIPLSSFPNQVLIQNEDTEKNIRVQYNTNKLVGSNYQIITSIDTGKANNNQINSTRISLFHCSTIAEVSEKYSIGSQFIGAIKGLAHLFCQLEKEVLAVKALAIQVDGAITASFVMSSQYNSFRNRVHCAQGLLAIETQPSIPCQGNSYRIVDILSSVSFAIASPLRVASQVDYTISDERSIDEQAMCAILSVRIEEYCSIDYCESYWCFSNPNETLSSQGDFTISTTHSFGSQSICVRYQDIASQCVNAIESVVGVGMQGNTFRLGQRSATAHFAISESKAIASQVNAAISTQYPMPSQSTIAVLSDAMLSFQVDSLMFGTSIINNQANSFKNSLLKEQALLAISTYLPLLEQANSFLIDERLSQYTANIVQPIAFKMQYMTEIYYGYSDFYSQYIAEISSDGFSGYCYEDYTLLEWCSIDENNQYNGFLCQYLSEISEIRNTENQVNLIRYEYRPMQAVLTMSNELARNTQASFYAYHMIDEQVLVAARADTDYFSQYGFATEPFFFMQYKNSIRNDFSTRTQIYHQTPRFLWGDCNGEYCGEDYPSEVWPFTCFTWYNLKNQASFAIKTTQEVSGQSCFYITIGDYTQFQYGKITTYDNYIGEQYLCHIGPIRRNVRVTDWQVHFIIPRTSFNQYKRRPF